MNSRILTILLLVGIAAALVIFGGAIISNARLTGDNTGYEPVQPIAYSHRLHAGELSLECTHCHSGAAKSRTAGIPSANVCMNCHRFVPAPFNVIREEDEKAEKENRKAKRIVSTEIQKVYDAMGLNDALTPDPSKAENPIEWVKVHNLPDFVYFDHRAHLNSGVDCQSCHGQVQTMERVRQVNSLSMGWCVNCHRDVNVKGVKGKPVKAPIDCVGCHY